MNKESRRYYGDIKSLIPSRGKYEKDLLKNYKQQIQELNISNSNITYNADGTYRSGNVEEDGDFNTISKYVDRYLFSEMEDGFTFE